MPVIDLYNSPTHMFIMYLFIKAFKIDLRYY